MEDLTFNDRVVIVTGAGRGIGRAHALLLAARGAALVVGDIGARTDGSGVDGDDPAGAVVAEITAAGGRAVAGRGDVSTEEGAASLVDAALTEFGRLDAVINNAGIIRAAGFLHVPSEEYQRHLDVHFFGSLFLVRAAWPHLKASGSGRIVNTVSAAMLGHPRMTHYGSSKGAVFGLTRNLALEGAPDGILVNALAPGAGTRMAEAADGTLPPEVMDQLRALKPDHVAPVAAYLVHPSCSVTGEVFNVAGGLVNRMVVLDTSGIYERDLSPETVAARIDQIMAITQEAVAQTIPVPAPATR